MALKFSERLRGAHAAADSLVCVGLDPDLTRLPEDLRDDPQPLTTAIRGLIGDEGWQTAAAVGSVFGRWPQIVGADLAAHTRPDRFTDGELLVTGLRSWGDNKIAIDETGLPVNASIQRTKANASPSNRAGTVVDFGASETAGARCANAGKR